MQNHNPEIIFLVESGIPTVTIDYVSENRSSVVLTTVRGSISSNMFPDGPNVLLHSCELMSATQKGLGILPCFSKIRNRNQRRQDQRRQIPRSQGFVWDSGFADKLNPPVVSFIPMTIPYWGMTVINKRA